MDENRNVQTDVELSDEELEQTAGGFNFFFSYTCPQCGRMYDPGSVPRTCTCGKVLHR